MIINKAALTRKSTVLVLTIFIVLAGFSAYKSLPLEANPDIQIPFVFVTTDYEGVAPADMEKLITIPLERKIKGISGIEELRSTSTDGQSIIAVKFYPDIIIDDALQKVRDKVDQAKGDLPSDLPDDPVVTEMNFSDEPILNVVLSGPFSLKRLKVFAEDFEDRFEAIPGVLDAEIVGGLEREIHVLFDLDRVAFYKMPFSDLISSVTNANVNVPGGTMDVGDTRFQVRVPEDFQHPDEIRSIVAFVRDGKPVYLRDVATIADAAKDPSTRSRLNGEQAVTLLIKKRSGENAIQIIDNLRAMVKDMEGEFPPTLNIDMTADQSRDIRMMVTDLKNNIITGLILVLAVVLIFIGGRSAVFVALSIPLSMLITFILLQAMGYTLNMVVLFSLILALGMLVDNGIVVVENVYRHMQEGATREEAAQTATDEVAWPVIASTLTTVGAFLPMIFWPGIMGEFMSYLPVTVIMALGGSLFVALVVNPVLSSKFQTIRAADLKPRKIDLMLDSMQEWYVGILKVALRNRVIVLGIALIMFVGSISSFVMFGAGVELFPDSDPKRAYVHVKAPVGTGLDASDRYVKVVEDMAKDYPDVRFSIAQTGVVGASPFDSQGSGTHVSKITLDFKDYHKRSRSSWGIVDEMRDKLKEQITGIEVRIEKEQNGPPAGDPVNMELAGKDMKVLGALTEKIMERIKEVPGVIDLKSDYISGKPEINVRVDKEKAAIMGLSASTIANTVRAAFGGTKAGVYREGKDEYDIKAKLPKEDRSKIETIKRLTISGPNGVPIPITSVAEVRLTSGLGGIKHIDQKRVVTISSDVTGRTANQVLADVDALMQTIELPHGYTYKFTGEQKDQQEASDFLSNAFVAAIFLIFLVLVTQFNSFATPFIILTSVMLSLIGVFLGLVITGKSFSIIMTGVGVISLAGVVVNNAIVLIDYFNQLLAEGKDVTQALIQAGRTRFRPVLLTAITTILGMLPMATGISFDFTKMALEIGSETAQWWGPMAVAVIFGLFVSTMLTLLVVPVLCSVTEGFKRRAR